MSLKNYLLFTSLIFLQSLYSFGQVKFNFIYDEYDFGVVEEGENLSCTFEFTNTGKDTIILKEETRDVRPGCGCTAAEFTKTAIPPGQKGFVKAGYNTQGRLGNFEKNITVSQNRQPYNILFIKGVVVKKTEKEKNNITLKKFPILSIDKKDHFFGKIEKEKSVSHKFILKNTGKDTLKITGYNSACTCLNYKLLNQKDNSEISYVLPGKTVSLEVNYKPKTPQALTDAKTSDKLVLFTNDPKIPKLELSFGSEIAK